MDLRTNNIQQLDDQLFDVLIVGGGINGAVSASALTSQGASVALIDQGDFASQTSQESSNLIWGGIKYLEGFEFGLVRKLCLSRNLLLRSYPSMVKEIRFLTTLERGFRWPRFFLFIGTLMYWLIGNFVTQGPRMLSNAALENSEPVIDTKDAIGGVEYSDAYLVDNDCRFVFRFVREALDHGGIVANYVRSIGAKQKNGVWHTRAKDLQTGRTITIRSKVVINACGPLADRHNRLTEVETQFKHVFSKGVHLLTRRLTKHKKVLAFFADDGRLFFVIPMGNKSCIGTTDTRVDKLPPEVTEDDRRFILSNINRRLNLDKPLTEADILAERCGVRPLVVSADAATDSGDWTSLSRKHEIDVDRDKRHISVYGGKLTDCINVGNEIARSVASLGVTLSHAGYRWYGEPSDAFRSEYFHQAKLMKLDAMTSPKSSEMLSTRLWRRYAARSLGLLEDIRRDPRMAEVLIEGTEYIRCELHHAAQHEMVTTMEDFLRRRSKIALVEHERTIRAAPGLQDAAVILFGEADAAQRLDEYFGRTANVDTESQAERKRPA